MVEGHCYTHVKWDFMSTPGFYFFTPVEYFFKCKAVGLRFALSSQIKSVYEILLLVNAILICLLAKQVHSSFIFLT